MPKTSEEIAESTGKVIGDIFGKQTELMNDKAHIERKVKACQNNINYLIEKFAEERGYHLFTNEDALLRVVTAIVNEEFEAFDGVDLSLGEKRE